MLPATLEAYLADHFGGRRGLLRYWSYQVRFALGGYRGLRSIEWQRVQRLVFICSGNICRSPLAEVVALEAGFNVASFGLHCPSGDPAEPRAAAIASEFNMPLDAHRTTALTDFVFDEGDLLIGMEPAHLDELPDRAAICQLTLLGLWGAKPFVYLHDPYSAAPVFFRRCELAVIDATQALCVAAGSEKAAPGSAGAGNMVENDA